MFELVENDWKSLLSEEFKQPYATELVKSLTEEYSRFPVYPEKPDIFRALQKTSFEDTKAVILGQDPYHGPGQAHGLSFSVRTGIKLPPSLKNIFKELQSDIGCKAPNHGSLEHWAEQGVLLLNSVLTVREGLPNSHKKLGWERFTDRIIAALGAREKPLVFILWGKHAQEKGVRIDSSRHLVLPSVHPSPLSAYGGFFGSKPFSRCNDFLKSTGQTEIDWAIPDQ